MAFSAKELYTIITIGICILWDPLAIYYLNFDFAGRIPTFFAFIALVINFNCIKRIIGQTALTTYILIALFMLINGFAHKSYDLYDQDGVWLLFKTILLSPTIMLLIQPIAACNLPSTLKFLSTTLLIYTCMHLVSASIDESGRLGLEMDSNEIALYASICFALLLLRLIRAELTGVWIILIVVPVVTVVLTGSRMGLGMVAIMSIFAAMTKIDLTDAKNILFLLVFGAAFFFLGDFIMSNTMVGERMLNTQKQGQEYVITTGTILDNFGDRGLQYYLSWPYFLNNFWTGIGVGQWRVKNVIQIAAHSEYMVQYVENGIICFTMFVVYNIQLLRPILQTRKEAESFVKNNATFLLGIIISILFAEFMLWTYTMHAVFVAYSILAIYPYISYEEQGYLEWEAKEYEMYDDEEYHYDENAPYDEESGFSEINKNI